MSNSRHLFSSHNCLHLKLILLGLMALLLSLAAPNSHSSVVKALYAVEIPVVDQKARTRRLAFDKGLKEVLIRVTGDSHIFSVIKQPRSSSYVKQFKYSVLESSDKAHVETTGKNKQNNVNYNNLLWIQFNETKVKEFVRNNALPFWGKLRDELVVWLAVNDSVNRYVLKSTDSSLLKQIVDESSLRRAVPVVWPEVKKIDHAIRFADVWSGFQRPLIKLSAEYSSGPIIIGRLHWKGEQWSSEWTLLVGENKSDWTIEHSDYNVLLAKMMDAVADYMGQQYALFDTGNINSIHSLAIQVDNINSIVALNSVKKYLSNVALVQNFRIETIENNRVFIDVSLRTNTDDFLSTLEQDLILILVPESKEKNPRSAFKRELAESISLPIDSKRAAYQFQFQP